MWYQYWLQFVSVNGAENNIVFNNNIGCNDKIADSFPVSSEFSKDFGGLEPN